MAFSMTVKQVFNFSSGRTVLTGRVEGNVPFIQPGRYALYQGGRLLREVEVEGEMMPKVTRGARTERAVSIAEQVGLPSGKPRASLSLVALS